MNSRRFDTLTRDVGYSLSRRALAPPLGGLLAVLLSGAVPAAAKKKKKKKTTLCLDGQTIQASKKKKKKLLKSGATPGACSPPPPPPPGCTPNCPGNSCGGDDGCGGICGCAAGSICHGEVCQSCTVPCSGNSVDCGVALAAALVGGGTLYLCPGRYTGAFTLNVNTTLIGAGKGNDPAVDTILDANGTGRVLDNASGVTTTLFGLRLTGGDVPDLGGGIRNEGRLTIDDCAITANAAGNGGGGIYHPSTATGPLKISNSTVAENEAPVGGGLYLINNAQAVTISACVISGNKSTPGNGGGIYNVATPVIITGSQITENSAANLGGGIYIDSGTLTFDSASSVTNNTAANGGGIRNAAGTVTLNGATVSGNSEPQCVGVDCPGT